MSPPLPRFRIYTKPEMYWRCLRDLSLLRARSGDDCRLLENKIKERTGMPYAVCMPKARVGIHLVIRALIRSGQEVILTPYTISDVINMVIAAGGIPVFADIERKTANIDPSEIERLITPNTGAVMVTHFHGYACDMDRIVGICRKHQVPLVEDAAQAFGASWLLKPVGTFGDAGIYSFGMYKNVNSFFGGMVVTPDKSLHDRLRNDVQNYPWQEITGYISKVSSALATDIATWPFLFKLFTYHVFRFGYLHNIKAINGAVTVDANPVMKRILPETYYRCLMPLQARLAIPQIDNVDEDTDRRIHFASMYYEGLKDLSDLLIAPLHKDRTHIYTYYTIQPPDRDALIRAMLRAGCDVAASHHKNCADLPAFHAFRRECPNARATAKSLIYLPTYPRYSDDDVRRNIRAIRKFFNADEKKDVHSD